MINTSELSRAILEAAHRGLVQERLQIESQIHEIERFLGGKGQTSAKEIEPLASASADTKTKKRTMSPEARKRIADAQKKRWAVSRGEATVPVEGI